MLCGAALMLTAALARAEVQTKTVDYRDGDAVLEGYLAWDDAATGARPGVLIVHQWKGLTDYERRRARMLAEKGYVAFALDIYGKGVRPTNAREAGEQAGKYRAGDRALYRSRLKAGLEVLKAAEGVDVARIAAIGYCFGGTGVLELARMGADIAGVVSFHGGLGTEHPAGKGDIKCKVLVEHGAADPVVTDEELLAFMNEMRATGCDWRVTVHGGAKHSFTEKEAGNDPAAPVGYDANADRRSWAAMLAFFTELFGA